MLDDDGTTDGHAVVWAASFRQLVDPAITGARHVRAAAEGRPAFTFPVVLPVASREVLLAPAVLTSSSRPALNIAWGLFPQWTPALTPAPGSNLDTALSYGKLALAHDTLDVIRELNGARHDLGQLRVLYPAITALIDDPGMLPPLPDEAPRGLPPLLPAWCRLISQDAPKPASRTMQIQSEESPRLRSQ